MTADQQATPPATLDDVPGWFYPVDRQLFVWFLDRQERLGISGDLIEMGAYMGRSAILIGDHVRAGETFTICDLFDSDAPDEENSGEMAMSYRSTLTRQAFDSNYLAFHDELPTVVQAPTFVLADGRLPAGSSRFIHIDASHLYEHVIGDIKVARDALSPEGVVVLDDYRGEHTPGVSAAVWEAVATMDLRPIALSGTKMYATWGDPEAVQDELIADSKAWDAVPTIEAVAGRRLLRLRGLPSMPPPPFRNSRFYDEIEAAKAATAEEREHSRRQRDQAKAAAARTPSARVKRIAKELLPPVAARAIRNALRGKR